MHTRYGVDSDSTYSETDVEHQSPVMDTGVSGVSGTPKKMSGTVIKISTAIQIQRRMTFEKLQMIRARMQEGCNY